jgi:phospholipid/cholesterol/gamma-HCH transport system substrate-binding protein
MAKPQRNNFKLGVFVLSGLSILMLSFFLIGRNSNLFDSDFSLRVRFSALEGLSEGSNVLFSGIQAGTVKNIEMLGDTTIEVTMRINSKVKPYIRSNAVASIGTEGLMGNKVINISPLTGNAQLVNDGALLTARKMASMEEIIQTLSTTNNNVAAISSVLKGTVLRIDSSELLKLIDDHQIAGNIRSTARSLQDASAGIFRMSTTFNEIITDLHAGKGTAGLLLRDTASARRIKSAIENISWASRDVSLTAAELNGIVKTIKTDVEDGKGSLHVMLRDTAFAADLKGSLKNIRRGANSFDENMEAIKHSFLFRGYFRAQERKKKNDKMINDKNQ